MYALLHPAPLHVTGHSEPSKTFLVSTSPHHSIFLVRNLGVFHRCFTTPHYSRSHVTAYLEPSGILGVYSTTSYTYLCHILFRAQRHTRFLLYRSYTFVCHNIFRSQGILVVCSTTSCTFLCHTIFRSQGILVVCSTTSCMFLCYNIFRSQGILVVCSTTSCMFLCRNIFRSQACLLSAQGHHIIHVSMPQHI